MAYGPMPPAAEITRFAVPYTSRVEAFDTPRLLFWLYWLTVPSRRSANGESCFAMCANAADGPEARGARR